MPAEQLHFVPFETLERFMQDCLVKAGVPKPEAQIVSDVLIESDKRGIDSHGIGRLKPIYLDRIDKGILNPVTHIEILKETETTAVLDGHNGMGHVVARKAMEMAVEKGEKHGLGMTVVRNSTHYGIAGYYTSMAVARDMVGISGTNARPSIAPTFGIENMLGTNPLTFGIPTDEEFPFTLDCATSVSQRGKIELYSRLGKALPEGWVIGLDGNTRTDTDQILTDLEKDKAALAPLGGIGETNGGYKGFGYATVVEIFSAAFQNGQFMKALNGFDDKGNPIPYPLGHFFMAINPDFFMGKALFKTIAGAILRDLRHSKLAPGEERIFTAGEKEYLAWKERSVTGCPIPLVLQKQMSDLCARYQLDYRFPWM